MIERVVIAGAGLAGLRTAEALRREGFDGSLVLIGAEDTPPYDRPPLSKEVLVGAREAGDTVLRPEAYYRELGVELRLGRPAERLDLRSRTVRVGTEPVPFDRLVIATGSRARTLPLGRGLAGVHVLRSLGDAVAVRASLASRPRVVIVGAGFIGAEVASSARTLGLDVTIIEAEPTPLTRALGPYLGGLTAGLHRDHGTRLLCGVSVRSIEGHGRVERVRLSDASAIDCDLVVVGVGVLANDEWLAASGIQTGDGVACDEQLNAGHPAVFAAGDVARWPNRLFGRAMRGHQWTNAAEQARHVARALLAGPSEHTRFEGSGYFWSDQYGTRIQFAGIPAADHVQIVDGSVEERRFLALCRKQDRLVGAFAMDSPRQMMLGKRLVEQRTGWRQALAAVA